jgi:hypothetical protein
MSTSFDREAQLKAVIKQMLCPLRNIPMDVIIESICDHEIWPYDGHARDSLESIVQKAGALINQPGIRASRPNEVGNYCEPHILKAIRNQGFEADIPSTQGGRKKSVGYPDVFARIEGKPFYIEIKSYNAKNKNTTQRSFYLSPSKDFKVCQDGYHLVFAFRMSKNDQGLFRADSCTVLDVRELLCDVKYEFNADNRRLYGNEALFVFKKDY